MAIIWRVIRSNEGQLDIVVCGAQKPFMYGGAEQHQEALAAQLRTRGHNVDLVRIPVAWEKGRLLDSPLAWRLVPIDADLVIATNFPSYYVRHPNKVVWLFHQHRGAYDGTDSGAEWSDFGLDDDALETHRLLTEWDNRALSEAVRLFSTSQVVADRLARYNGLAARALYHPPPLHERLRPGPFGDYVFTVNRFDTNKRPDLIVEGLAHAPASLRAVAAGRGPLREVVAARAEALGLAERVSLPGFVPDDEVVEQFAGALAVLYAPADEDYGYVTLQAFRAGKPVITAADSGGVLEWVRDGETGIVTDGSPEALGAAMTRLAEDPELARAMGERGRELVAELDWSPALDALLGE
jgi:glycosyltransferase involved in cell wall biosynthesis